MARASFFQFLVLLGLLSSINAAAVSEKYIMDQMCGKDYLVLDGDTMPGIAFPLTSNNKYKENLSCTAKFRAALPTQRLVITVEKMNITDCPGDTLRIYDGTTLMNKETKQQCGSPASFTFTTSTTQASLTFTSNSAIESWGFQVAIAVHFPTMTSCSQNLGFFQCGNKNCISKALACDGRNHCGDGTDEKQCSIISG